MNKLLWRQPARNEYSALPLFPFRGARFDEISAMYFMLSLFLLFFVFPVHAEEKWFAQKISGDARNASWCGEQRIIWDGGERGIYLYERTTSAEKVIKKKISPFWSAVNLFCSPDGRFVFYSHLSSSSLWDKVYAFDASSGNTSTIDCLTKEISLSSDLGAAVTISPLTTNCRVIKMPWGKDVPIQQLSGYGRPGFSTPALWKWFPDNRRVILGYKRIGDPMIVNTPKGPESGEQFTFSIYDIAERKLIFVEDLPSSVGPRFLFLDTGRVMYFYGKEKPSDEIRIYRVDTTAIKPRAVKLKLSNVIIDDLHPRWGMLYQAGEYRGLGLSVWLTTLDADGPGKQISDLMWARVFGFSPSGDALLMSRLDVNKLPNNETIRIPSSLYVLTPSKQSHR